MALEKNMWRGMAQQDVLSEADTHLGDSTTISVAPKPERQTQRAYARRPFRVNGELISTGVRAGDAGIIAFATLSGIGIGVPDWFMYAPLWQVAPYVGGALALSWAVWVFGRFQLDDDETVGAHLAKTAAGLGFATVFFALLLAPFEPPREYALGVALFAGGASVGVLSLHAVAALLVRALRARGYLARNVVLIGAGDAASRISATKEQKGELNLIGAFNFDGAPRENDDPNAPLCGGVEELLNWPDLPAADQVIIDPAGASPETLDALVQRLSVIPNNVAIAGGDYGLRAERPAAELAGGLLLAHVSGFARTDEYSLAKRAQDLIFGVPLLLFFLPIMAVIAVLVKFSSPGPVFFKQARHGLNNRIIKVWKFRTMRHEPQPAGPMRQVEKDDARVTGIGKFLRRTSLDELPQLINVVLGSMSLVGPRPHAVGMRTGDVATDTMVANYHHRHRVKPGITGWAQINGSRGPLHSAEEVSERIAYDLEYVDRASFWLDMYIILRTAPSLLGDSENTR